MGEGMEHERNYQFYILESNWRALCMEPTTRIERSHLSSVRP